MCKGQFKSQSPETKSANVQRQEKILVDVSAQAERADLPFLYRFVLFGPSVNWMMSTCVGKGNLLYAVY